MELSDELYDKITDLTDEGNDLCDEEEYEKALEKYKKALKLIPEPKTDWEASTWVYTAIGDCYYFLGEYSDAIEALNSAMLCPDGVGNGFITLRLGECYYELDDKEKAADYFVDTYMIEGMEIFEEEDDYKDFAEEILKEKEVI